jgi:hypothetical protein
LSHHRVAPLSFNCSRIIQLNKDFFGGQPVFTMHPDGSVSINAGLVRRPELEPQQGVAYDMPGMHKNEAFGHHASAPVRSASMEQREVAPTSPIHYPIVQAYPVD